MVGPTLSCQITRFTPSTLPKGGAKLSPLGCVISANVSAVCSRLHPKRNNVVSSVYIEPLFLTPYLMSGDYKTAQRLANVTDPLDGIGVLPFESYCGYITTNDTNNPNIFFWFFLGHPFSKPKKFLPRKKFLGHSLQYLCPWILDFLLAKVYMLQAYNDQVCNYGSVQYSCKGTRNVR